MVVKVYISGISGNKEVKKRQQRVLMILDSKCISYEVVDITEPGKEPEKDYMQTNSTSNGATVNDLNPRHPLPPQLFNDADYCGDYDQFDLANEIDTLEVFLKVELPKEEENDTANENENPKEEEPSVPASESVIENGTEKATEEVTENDTEKATENAAEDKVENVTETIEKVESNGVASSREASVEVDKKSNGDIKPETEDSKEEEEEEEEEEEDEDEEEAETKDDTVELKKGLTPSEDLIKSEQASTE